MRNGEVSYWWQALGGFPPRRPSLPGPLDVDVCVVGGGYTGLWTAYYLAGLRPELRIVPGPARRPGGRDRDGGRAACGPARRSAGSATCSPAFRAKPAAGVKRLSMSLGGRTYPRWRADWTGAWHQ